MSIEERSMSYYKDNDDLRFYFDRAIDWRSIVEITERGALGREGGFASVEEAVAFYREIAEMVGDFTATEIAPVAAAIDRRGVRLEHGEAVTPPELDAIFEKINGLELHGMCLPRELGGMNCPLLLYYVNTEILARADVSVMAHHGFHGGMAMAMLLFSVMEGSTEFDAATGRIVKTRFGDAIAEILRGQAWGCMDITEPDAGSDMARLKAVGEQDEQGNWFVTGQKIFITSGHGKYHFVIARTEKPTASDDPFAGLRGLSMFLVPTYEEGPAGRRRIVRIDRIEEKLGHHGSVTASLCFERAPAQLVGRRGDGFHHMLTLMNGARLGVGFESLGLCEAAYRLARDYAAGRPSMGKTIDRHEIIADYLDEMRTDIQGLRAIAFRGAVAQELAEKARLWLRAHPPANELERKRLERLAGRERKAARRVTPLLKYLAAEKAVEMARRAVQIHGGNGYMRDFGAEKLLRDATVMPIYEGTSQIQALMAMKDTLQSILQSPQAFVARQAQARWRSLSAKDPLERRVARVQLSAMGAEQSIIAKTASSMLRALTERPLGEWVGALRRRWDPKRDFAHALLHAERLTRLLADELVSETLLEQARRHPERRELCERWLDRAEPRSRYLSDEITTTGERLLRQLGGAAPSAPPAAIAAE
jgi:alkylation response protein AidB-like acyl-CoA dehydrogenase